MKNRGLLVVLLVTLAACGGKKGVGESCADSAECGAPTTCILNGARHIVNGALACQDTNKLCSKTCGADSDCSSLGTGYICLKDCFQGSCLQGSRL